MYIWYKLLMVSYNIFERVHIKGRKKEKNAYNLNKTFLIKVQIKLIKIIFVLFLYKNQSDKQMLNGIKNVDLFNFHGDLFIYTILIKD